MKNIAFIFLVALSSFLLYHFWDKNNYDATPESFVSDDGGVTFHLDRSYAVVTKENQDQFSEFALWDLEQYFAPQFASYFLVSKAQKIIAYTITIPFEGFAIESLDNLVDELKSLPSQKKTQFKINDGEMRTSNEQRNRAKALTLKLCRYRLLPKGDGMRLACIGGFKKERELLTYLLNGIEFNDSDNNFDNSDNAEQSDNDDEPNTFNESA